MYEAYYFYEQVGFAVLLDYRIDNVLSITEQ